MCSARRCHRRRIFCISLFIAVFIFVEDILRLNNSSLDTKDTCCLHPILHFVLLLHVPPASFCPRLLLLLLPPSNRVSSHCHSLSLQVTAGDTCQSLIGLRRHRGIGVLPVGRILCSSDTFVNPFYCFPVSVKMSPRESGSKGIDWKRVRRLSRRHNCVCHDANVLIDGKVPSVQ